MRFRLYFLSSLLLALIALGPLSLLIAQDRARADGDDPIAVELSKAKQEYEVAADKARETLLAAFALQEKKITDNPSLNAEKRIKQIESLEQEKKMFESEGELPKSPGTKAAGSDYRIAVLAARRKCEKAFDAAAEKYVKKDLAAAKAVLAEKAEFFEPTPSAVMRKRIEAVKKEIEAIKRAAAADSKSLKTATDPKERERLQNWLTVYADRLTKQEQILADLKKEK